MSLHFFEAAALTFSMFARYTLASGCAAAHFVPVFQRSNPQSMDWENRIANLPIDAL
jgi:hypothetical protein